MTDQRRSARLDAIASLLQQGTIRRQEELLGELKKQGYDVTQSSVSRDLEALRIRKVEGVYRVDQSPRFTGLRSAAAAGPNLVVLKADVGTAPRLGVELDDSKHPTIVGTIAGDDTLFIAVRTQSDQAELARWLGVSLG